MELGWKSGKTTPHPPFSVNVPPLYLYAPHNWAARETQDSSSSPVCLLSLRVYPCLDKLSVYFLKLSASSPVSFVRKLVFSHSGRVWLSVTPWTAARQASLSFTISRSLLKLCPLSQWCHPMVSSSAFRFSFCLQSFFSESALNIGWPKYWSFSFSISPMNIQGWFPLGLTGFISLQSRTLNSQGTTGGWVDNSM